MLYIDFCYFIRGTNHNKSDNKYDINLHDDEEMDALEWKQPIKTIKKSEEYANYLLVNIPDRILLLFFFPN